MEKAEWEALEAQVQGVTMNTMPAALARVVRHLGDQEKGWDLSWKQVSVAYGKLDERINALEEAIDRARFDRRAEALKLAREHVNGLPSEQKNERGYRDHALRPAERIQQELQVARYLLDDEG